MWPWDIFCWEILNCLIAQKEMQDISTLWYPLSMREIKVDLRTPDGFELGRFAFELELICLCGWRDFEVEDQLKLLWVKAWHGKSDEHFEFEVENWTNIFWDCLDSFKNLILTKLTNSEWKILRFIFRNCMIFSCLNVSNMVCKFITTYSIKIASD